MRAFARFGFVSVGSMFLLGTSATSFCQNPLKLNLRAIKPGYVRMPKININSVKLPSTSIRFVLPKGVTSTRGLFLNDGNGGGSHNSAHRHAGNHSASIRGLDTVPTFAGAFNSTAPSIDQFQSSDGFTTTSPYIMIGDHPLLGGTTVIPAKITTVSEQLLNPDGSLFATVPFEPFEDLTEDSPNFRDSQLLRGSHAVRGCGAAR